jgi:hypothetical protein
MMLSSMYVMQRYSALRALSYGEVLYVIMQCHIDSGSEWSVYVADREMTKWEN